MELNYLDLFKFYLFNSGSCSCRGGYGCVWGVLTCPHTHAHACTCKDMCNAKIYMYGHCKWPLPWRHSCLSCLTCMCVSPTHPHHQLRYLNSIWGFEICGHYPTCGWVGCLMGGWVGWWVGSCHITKNLINLDLIKIFQFCLEIYDLWRYPHLWVGVCMGCLVSQWVGSCQISKYQTLT